MMRTIAIVFSAAFAAVAFVPQTSADTCVGGYNPDALANVCYVTSSSEYHCGQPVVGGLCPGVKVIVNVLLWNQVAVNYEDCLFNVITFVDGICL